MRASTFRLLVLVLVIAAFAFWVAWPTNNQINLTPIGINYVRDIPVREGLDLQGGIQVLLQADVAPGQAVDPDSMQAARQVIERRVNALGVSEPVIQLAQNNRIIVELPGVKDPDQAIKTFGNTGLLEFVDLGSNPLPQGMQIATSLGPPPATATPPASAAGPGASSGDATATAQGTPSAQGTPTASASPTSAASPSPTPTYQTIMTGKDLSSASVQFDQLNRPYIRLTLTSEGARIFGDFTSSHVGQYLAITLDKTIISAPVIKQPIVGGDVQIDSGNPRGFPLQEAQDIVIQLKYGALPVPLKVVQNRTVGPTLGQDSVQKSVVAGIIGLGIVAAFMILNYRVPGVVATVALAIYAAIVFALFKLIPVTLTVAGIAGFILSIGMAVDANILIFERTKEELRAGRSAVAAIDAGFSRAWNSIRDSNFSTLITCLILFWFGSQFGASIIQGFALTLGIGVVVSMFTAITVTRTFLKALQALGALPVVGPIGLTPRPAAV